jgi:hypothetical protein
MSETITPPNRRSFTDSGLTGVLSLFIVLSLLKFAGVIDWDWWLVTIPLWGPVAGVFVLVWLAVSGLLLFLLVKALLKRFLGMRLSR